MGIFDGITGLFSKNAQPQMQTQMQTQTQTQTLPPKQPYTYMFPGSLVKFKNDPDGISKIYKIDIRENGGKVINPKIFYGSPSNFSQELLDAVDYKIQQQYEYNNRWKDNDGSSPWDNWVPGESQPPTRGGKRGRKSRKSKKSRRQGKTRKQGKN